MTLQKMIKHVLLVEDSEAGRRLMQEAFKIASFDGQLNITENGEELLQFLKQEEGFVNAQIPDLILLDLNLPGKSGFQVLDGIKKDKRFQNIPVIVLTGSSAASDIQTCAEFGCKYLMKPSNFSELIALVKSLPDFF